jgi:hypothetical protein
MTVQEMIRQLEKCEQDAIVVTAQYNSTTRRGYEYVQEIKQRDTKGGGYTVTLY